MPHRSLRTIRLHDAPTADMLAMYGAILTELRERGIVRSENSPVGDYAEYLAARALALTLVHNSSIGYDGVDAEGLRYQVKGRRITARNPSRELSTIRGLEVGRPDPFDWLVGVLFDGQFKVTRAALVPIATVRSRANRQEHVNGWRLMLTDAVWALEGVRDVTALLEAAAT